MRSPCNHPGCRCRDYRQKYPRAGKAQPSRHFEDGEQDERLYPGFRHGNKDSKRFPKSGGWGYALFNYEAASDQFTADPSPSDCGHTCHVAVKAKDHIFHQYQNR